MTWLYRREDNHVDTILANVALFEAGDVGRLVIQHS